MFEPKNITPKTRRRALVASAAIASAVIGFAGAIAMLQVACTAYHRGELQEAADRTALQIGEALAKQCIASRTQLPPTSGSITFGRWDAEHRRFLPAIAGINAVEVVARGSESLDSQRWLAPWLMFNHETAHTRAVATVRPRDIVFVVEASGAMTTGTLAAVEYLLRLAGERRGCASDDELRLLYNDLGFGDYPGRLEPFGSPWRLEGPRAYDALTSRTGPLANKATSEQYRILPEDPISIRRRKAYQAVIEQQVERLMPSATPAPDRKENFGYWSRYLDELLASDDPQARIGYASYIRFLLDFGRDLRAGGEHANLSPHSRECRWHQEQVGQSTFLFPPRTQPMHDVRRGLLAAFQDLEDRNRAIKSSTQQDRVAIVTYGTLSTGKAKVEQSLTSDFAAAANVATRLQAAGTRSTLTGSLPAIRLAEQLLGQSRRQMTRGCDAIQMIVLIQAGIPHDSARLLEQLTESSRRGLVVRVVAAGPESEGNSSRLPAVAGESWPSHPGWNTACKISRRLDGSVDSVLRDALAFSSAILVQ